MEISNKKYGILLTAIGILSIALVVLIVAYGNQVSALKEVKQTISSHPNQQETYKDLYNTEHQRAEQITTTYEAARIVYEGKLDSISKRVKTDDRNITNIIEAEIVRRGGGKTRVIHDTFVIRNDSTYYEEGYIVGDSIFTSHKIKIDLTFVEYWKRKWLLGKTQHYIDGYAPQDTSVHITGIQGINIGYEYSRWAIGPYIGYDIINQRMGAGVSVQYNLIRFKKKTR